MPDRLDLAGIADNLTRLRVQIADAASQSGRLAEAVTLIAVSKTHPIEAVAAAVAAGQVHFGENRVQEAAAKFAPPPGASSEVSVGGTPSVRPRLHLIGPLQTNKARDAVRIADVIESVDRPRLADALADAIEREGRSPDLLVQVNVGHEAQKAGVAPEEAERFIEQCRERFGVRLVGLMCVPPATQPPGPYFATLADMAARHGLAVLSMGMSADFRIAIQHGATWVRLGSAVFGSRG